MSPGVREVSREFDMFQRNRSLSATAAAVVVTGMLSPVAVGLAGSSAQAKACDVDTTKYTTTKGTAVWKPTNLSAGHYQRGGTQSISYSDGEQLAKTKGSSDSAGGSGGVNFGIGSASASYNHTWERSTTVSTSTERAFSSSSPQLPRDKFTRWTLYKKAYKFKTTVHVTFIGGRCDPRTHHWWVVLPTKSWSEANLHWDIQDQARPGKLL